MLDIMVLFKVVKSPTRLPEAIVRQIENKILLGQLKPDSMLPPETNLMKQFGVSRNTVREALRMLEASGMIKIKQGSRGGSLVTRLTNEFIGEFLLKALRLSGVSGANLYQFRLVLEPSMVEMLAKMYIDPELLSEMGKNIEEVKELFKANEVTGYRNMDFHVLLAMATGNPMFIIILNTLRSCLDVITPIVKIRPKTQNDTIGHHQKILDAIKKQDPVKARRQMHKHLVQLYEVLQKVDRS